MCRFSAAQRIAYFALGVAVFIALPALVVGLIFYALGGGFLDPFAVTVAIMIVLLEIAGRLIDP